MASTYYEDESQHGSYQYETLENIINSFLAFLDDDDYVSNVPRYKMVYHGKKIIQQLYYDVVREVKAVEIELSPTLTVTLPPDFVNYVRISWVDEEGKLHPMAADNRQSIANVYLQDHEYNLLFDSDGCILTGSGVREDNPTLSSSDSSTYSFCDTYQGYTPNVNLSNVFVNGKYILDKQNGLIQFGADAFGKNIVLEYISDGLFTGCCGGEEEDIRIHKFAEQVVLDYIFYALIKNRRNVPANEKQRARKEFYNTKRLAKRRINSLRFAELLQTFRGSTTNIEDLYYG